jgi:predicted kinase
VVLDGLGADVEPAADLGVREALAEEVEHVVLPGREVVEGHPGPGARGTEAAEQRGGAVDVGLSSQALEDGHGCPGVGHRRRLVAGGRQRPGPLEQDRPAQHRALLVVEVALGRGQPRRGLGRLAARRRHASRGQIRLGSQRRRVAGVGDDREAFGGRARPVDITRELDLDEGSEELALSEPVGDDGVETAVQRGGGEVVLATGEVHEGERERGGRPVLEAAQQLSGLVDAALQHAQVRQPAPGVGTVGVGAAVLPRLDQGRLALGPPSDATEDGPVGEPAMGVQHLGSTAEAVEEELGDEAGPLVGPLRRAGVVAGRQHGAEARRRHLEVVHLAGGERGHGLVEASEAVGGAPLRDEGVAAVGQRPDLEARVAEGDGDGERLVGSGGQLGEIRRLAGDVGEQHVAPLDAWSLALEQTIRPAHPTAGGGVVAERGTVELGQAGRHPGCPAALTQLAVAAERVLPLGACTGPVVVAVAEAGEQLVGVGRVGRLDGREERADRFLHPPLGEQGLHVRHGAQGTYGGAVAGTIVVSGAPGTGKSTVALGLADALARPLLSLDVLKEALADVLGLGDEDWSDRVGDAAAEVVFRLARSFPAAVAEGWWRRERRVRAIEEFAGCVEVFCRCDAELAVARATARLGVTRHPIHRDTINPALLDGLATTVREAQPLGLGAALIEVDTTEPYDMDDLVARVQAANWV